MEITIEISMDYILWMLEHPEDLNEDERLWVETFKNLFDESLKTPTS